MVSSAVMHEVQPDLIYDLGMHTGLDTKYYLDKGFRVVAVEANPTLIERGHAQFADAITAGKLQIVDRALWSGEETEVSFFINKEKDDWSSIHEGNANREGKGVDEIRVQTTDLTKLFSEYGLPYYAKCDLEGADEVFVDQLTKQALRPTYVSAEVSGIYGAKMIAKMFAAGYDKMQIVNQAFNAYTPLPNPPLEGEFVDVRFNGHMSGLFGKELTREKWSNMDTITQNYLDFFDLKSRDEGLASGWVDIHFTTSAQLAAISGGA